jgi:hypothetical protein
VKPNFGPSTFVRAAKAYKPPLLISALLALCITLLRCPNNEMSEADQYVSAEKVSELWQKDKNIYFYKVRYGRHGNQSQLKGAISR